MKVKSILLFTSIASLAFFACKKTETSPETVTKSIVSNENETSTKRSVNAGFERVWSEGQRKCVGTGTSCWHPPIKCPQPKITGLDLTLGSPTLVANYFNNQSQYQELFSYLDNPENISKLTNLQSGNYSLIKDVKDGINHYFAGPLPLSRSNYDFILTLELE